jgi:hypothetical protein
MEVVMKSVIGKLVFFVMILIVVSGCGDPCDGKYDVGDFIDDVLFEEDIYDDDSDDIVCVLEDVMDFIDLFDGGGDNEGPEPTYYYDFKVWFTLTDVSGESILDVEPSSYNLLLNTENCGSLMYSKTPSVYSDYIRAGRGYLCEQPPIIYSANECITITPSETIDFEFDDFLPASCGDSADMTLTIIVDHPGYAPVSAAYDFTLHYWKPGGVVNLINSRADSRDEIYLQLAPE